MVKAVELLHGRIEAEWQASQDAVYDPSCVWVDECHCAEVCVLATRMVRSKMLAAVPNKGPNWVALVWTTATAREREFKVSIALRGLLASRSSLPGLMRPQEDPPCTSRSASAA